MHDSILTLKSESYLKANYESAIRAKMESSDGEIRTLMEKIKKLELEAEHCIKEIERRGGLSPLELAQSTIKTLQVSETSMSEKIRAADDEIIALTSDLKNMTAEVEVLRTEASALRYYKSKEEAKAPDSKEDAGDSSFDAELRYQQLQKKLLEAQKEISLFKSSTYRLEGDVERLESQNKQIDKE